MWLFFFLSFFAAIFLLIIQKGQCAHIVGGKESIPHSRPYMATFLHEDTGNFRCGGSLIKENWVLTAAHCFPLPRTYVVLGAHKQSRAIEEGLQRQKINIAKMFVYPDYNLFTFEHDIMLLKLNKSAQINEYVDTIQLPSTDDDVPAETNCLVTGWGTTYYEQKWLSDELREVNLTVVDRKICNDENHYNHTITRNMLCADARRGGKASCQGDSGGPLVCGVQQRGIVSFGINCGHKQYPDVFTRLTKTYISWIQKTIRDNP